MHIRFFNFSLVTCDTLEFTMIFNGVSGGGSFQLIIPIKMKAMEMMKRQHTYSGGYAQFMV